MRKFLPLFFYCLISSGDAKLFAQAKSFVSPKKTAKPAAPKPVVKSKPANKISGIVKPTKFTTVNNSIKIPAKTEPSVRVKTKITEKKIVIKSKPAKLPEGVNKNEYATVVLSVRETAMIDEINILRRDPKAYIPFVESYLKLHRSNNEMQTAGKELIRQLKDLSALPALTLNPVMYSAAKQFGLSLKEADEIEHSELPYFENLSLGHANVRDAIMDLLVDDDIADRGHRRNLLNGTISKIAVYEVPGALQGYHHCFIQVFK